MATSKNAQNLMTVALTPELKDTVKRTAAEDGTDSSKLIRAALGVFFSARRGAAAGHLVGIADPETRVVHTEISNLIPRRKKIQK